jgi:hypothetical protein
MLHQYLKVIIWGHPLYSHTHSYVHSSYYKAFKYLGYDVYWFHDGEYPEDFDYENCLFITEGFADANIPLNETSCYMVMYCPSPKKYEGVGRYIDIRMAAKDFKDHIQEYSLDKSIATKVGPACYFVPKTSEKVRIKNDYHDYEMSDFDKLYISWATNLLPHEIDYDDMYIPREQNIYFCGTIGTSGEGENISNWKPFLVEVQKAGYGFIPNNPWSNPLSDEEVIRRMRESLLGVDIRGPLHIKQGLLTCRVFKNISYGHLGVTNSEEIYNELEGKCVYNPDTAQLFHDAMAQRENAKLIEEGMKLVKENHTYVNRVNSILSIL